MAVAEALVGLGRPPVLPPIPAHLALGRTITGFDYVPWDARNDESEDGTGTLPADSPRPAEKVELTAAQATSAAEGLRELQDILRDRQDKVYDEECRGHDEMAAQDQEFEELDRKIAEIDELLATLEA
jgi:hypothetical protein